MDLSIFQGTDGDGGVDTYKSIENINGSDFKDNITGDDNNNQLFGQDRDDTLTGGAGNDTLIGGAGNDTLIGGVDNDSLVGGLGIDTLTGGAGNNILIGGLGADVLEGGAFSDTYRYNSLSERGDIIKDFDPFSDVFELKGSGFSPIDLGSLGTLSSEKFVIDTVATSPSHRVIYDGEIGAVYVDQDGNGPVDQILLATLLNKPSNLSSDDFIIID